jgi:hypothetical protein
VIFWDVGRGLRLRRDKARLQTASGPVSRLAVSSDGARIVLAHKDETVTVWGVANRQLIHGFCQFTLPLTALALAPDGRTLAVGFADGRIKLLDILDGVEVRTLQDPGGAPLRNLQFSQDGHELFAVGKDRTLKAWGVDQGRIEEPVRQLQTAVFNASRLLGSLLERSEIGYQSRIAEADKQRQVALSQARAVYEAELILIRANALSMVQSAGLEAARWQDTAWHDWHLSTRKDLPSVVRVGQLEKRARWDTLALPALLPVLGASGIVIETAGPQKEVAARMIESLLVRLLALVPPTKLRLTLVDPIGLGQSAAALMPLADYDASLITGKDWIEPQDIDQHLAGLAGHMEDVAQKCLRNQFNSIEEYNEQAGDAAEPYRVLAVFDFPASFSETAARRLASIAQDGPRCGVYVILLVDTGRALPYDISLAELEQACTVIASDTHGFVWQDQVLQDCRLDLDVPPGKDLLDRIVKRVGTAAKDAFEARAGDDEHVAPQRGDARAAPEN